MFALILGVIAPMDIFRKEPYGTQLWVELCPDVETAKARVKVLAATNPGEYFIYSALTGHKQFLRPDDDGTSQH